MTEDFLQVFFEKEKVREHSQILFGSDEHDSLALQKYADIYATLTKLGNTPRNLVDVGCGPARISLLLAERLVDGTITFLDISPAMIEEARKNSALFSRQEIGFDFLVGEAEQIKEFFPKGSIDAIMARHVVNLMRDPVKFLRDAYEVLRPGGRLVFSFVGHTVYDFSDTCVPSLFQNQFYRRLIRATNDELSEIVMKLDYAERNYLAQRGIIKDNNHSGLRMETFEPPKLNQRKVSNLIEQAGIPAENVFYYLWPEVHTVAFKKAFSLNGGSIPVPGLWYILPLLIPIDRYNAVQKIYDRAFPKSGTTPIYLTDAVYIIAKN